MISGTPKFDSLAIKEIAVEFLQMGQVNLTGKAAFVNSVGEGVTHGWTRGTGAIWSQETILRLQALRESMEMDLGSMHFVGVNVNKLSAPQAPADIGGLGEYLEDADQA